MTLKPRTKLMDTLLVALSVVEKGKKGSEQVGDGRGTEVVFEGLNHLESLAKVLGVGVLKEVTNRAILEGRADLALPELASKGVATISHQEQILAGSGKIGGLKPVENEVP
jgi:hypothetical protein